MPAPLHLKPLPDGTPNWVSQCMCGAAVLNHGDACDTCVPQLLEEIELEAYPAITCPQCGAGGVDVDGFGFVACSACGRCTHPSRTGGVCGICGDVETEQ